MIKVLSVASECVPLVKTGGLADVVGALPLALAHQGVDMKVLLPGYPEVLKNVATEVVCSLKNGQRILSSEHAGISLFILDAPAFFDRPGGIYASANGSDWPDNIERFAALSLAAAELALGAVPNWVPEVVHCHDWQAGLAPYYMKQQNANAKSVMTIHNIAFKGNAPAAMVKKLNLAPADFTPERLEYFGTLSTLKAGLVYADRLTTVSPSYARELMTPEFGMGLEGLLQYRRDDMVGILNGIDTEVWSPAHDPHIDAYRGPSGKKKNKAKLRERFSLEPTGGPLCVVVSRLTQQKGLDLLIDALPALTDRGGQLILLGNGDPTLEKSYRAAASHPNVAVHIGYDEALSHLVIAGGDAILVPSRFEPCGLTQLYGLAYGTLPVVALTGGLADTVITANAASLEKPCATGLTFWPVNADALRNALVSLCKLYAQPILWAQLQRNAMKQRVDWTRSAARYASLYGELTE